MEAKFNGIMTQINLLFASGIAKSLGPVVPPVTPAMSGATQRSPLSVVPVSEVPEPLEVCKHVPICCLESFCMKSIITYVQYFYIHYVQQIFYI